MAWIRRRALVVGAAGVVASSMLMPVGARASNGTVLILGTSVTNGASSDEALEAISLGFSVNVVDGPTWDAMTTAQFSSYAAIILGDPTCSTSSSASVGAAETNVSTWSSAVTGNISVVGTDPAFHHRYGSNNGGALTVTNDAVAYALSRRGATGAYISLSCYYFASPPSTSVSVLSGLGGFSVHGDVTCSDSGHVEANVASATGSWSNLTDANLLSWGCSIHENFDSWPGSFTPLAIDPSATPPNFTGSDGTAGQPYILVSGQGACQVSFAASADSTKVGVTDLIGTCFSPGEKVDVLLNTESGAMLVDQPTTDQFGAIDDSFLLPAYFNVPLPNAKGFNSITVPLRHANLFASPVYQLDVIGEKAGDGGSLQVSVNSDGALIPMEAAPHTTSGAACLPASVTAPAATAPSNLTVSGRWIMNQNQRVKLASVNWYGAEQADFVPGGLQCQSVATIAAVIRNNNFNSVRLPWSNAMLEEDPGSCAVSPAPLEQPCISPGLLLANPVLQGSHALGIYRAVIDALGAVGVMVVLDDHTTDAQWAPGDGNGIWWGGVLWDDVVAPFNCPGGDSRCWHRRIDLWKNDWITMVNLFQESNVIGVDLRNEPDDMHSYGLSEYWCKDTCSTTSSPPAQPSQTEWGPSAEWAGNAILSSLSAGRQLLIFVEGIRLSQDLTAVHDHWLTLQSAGHLVYSPHSYPFFRFGTYFPSTYDSLTKDQLATALGNAWGYIVTQDIPQNPPFTAPVWVGEFGDCNLNEFCASAFRDNFIAYLRGADFDWAYWAINANYSDAGSSQLSQYWFKPEKYGILNLDWNTDRTTLTSPANLPSACTQGACP